jgi:hypothetical protein
MLPTADEMLIQHARICREWQAAVS